MTFPVHEQITNAIHERLLGYDRQSLVLRPEMLSDFSPANQQIVIVQSDPAANADFSCSGNPPALAYTAPYEIVCIIRQREKSEESVDTLLADFTAGAIMTLCTPQASWHTWGGLALDTRMTGTVKNINDGYCTLNLSLEVIFRTDENNPYNQR